MRMMQEWAMQITGIIILSTICDIIVAEGDIKKYIKPIFGFLLIATIIRPIVGTQWDKISLDIPDFHSQIKYDLEKNLSHSQTESVMTIYTDKIEQKIEEVIESNFEGEFLANAHINSGDKDFGKIERIDILTKSETTIDPVTVKKILSKEFGTKSENIAVKMR